MSRWILTVAALSLVLAGCSSPADTSVEPGPDVDDSVQESQEGSATESDDAGDTSGYTDADIGTGALEESGVIYDDIGGQCELSRGGGTEVVDDPYADGVRLTLAIAGGGVTWESTNNSEFVISGAENVEGEYIGIGFSGPRTELEFADLALVWFTGVANDGEGAIAGEIVCLVVTSP